jgi:hypothetical protein
MLHSTSYQTIIYKNQQALIYREKPTGIDIQREFLKLLNRKHSKLLCIVQGKIAILKKIQNLN